ncbi:MAG TPA: flagellar hook-associated protein FlgL [Acidiferrobacterales bacterium]|nr:flagellar hook-associated protein FlgL [Acidiferrobacterales bacterium]
MRISTSQIFQGSLNAMLDNQSSLTHTQLQMSTGRRILTPSDDPVGSAAVLDLNQAIDNTHQYQTNADVAVGRLQLGESTLGDVGNLLQRVRELTVQANNDSQTPETRRYMATELRQLRSQLIGMANTRDATGEYLFAGFKGNSQPFVPNAAGQVTYVGDPGSRYLQVGPGQQIVDGEPGSAVFMGIRNGNGTFTTLDNPANTGSGIIVPGTVVNPAAWVPDTYTITFPTPTTYEVRDSAAALVTSGAYQSDAAIAFNGIQVILTGQPGPTDSFTVGPSANQDVFSTVQNIITTLETYPNTPAGMANLHNAVNRGMVDIDQAMGSMLEARARAGARLNTLDSQKSANDAFLLLAQQSLSNVQDLDYAEAASRLNRQLLSLQATQQTFVKVQGLSLFNYLR